MIRQQEIILLEVTLPEMTLPGMTLLGMTLPGMTVPEMTLQGMTLPGMTLLMEEGVLQPLPLMEEEMAIHHLFHHQMVGQIKQLVLPLLLHHLQVVMAEEIM